jgi:hypothetical protein
MTKTHRLLRYALPLLGLLAVALPLSAAPRDELLRLVPGDVGFCLVVQDLRTHSTNLLESPFAEQFRKSPLAEAMTVSVEYKDAVKKLSEVETHIKKEFGVDSAQLRDEIYGDAIVLAYRPAPDGKPDGDEGVLLLRARNAVLLAKLVQKLNEVQKKSGELKQLDELKHEGSSYFLRVEGNGQRHFYYLNGGILAFTSKESMLKRVIDLDQKAAAGVPALARDMKKLGVQDAMLIWWINPRAFDAALKQKVAEAKPAELPGLQRMQLYWEALAGAAFTLTPKKSAFEMGLAFLGRDGDMPEPARKFFTGDNRPSELWSRFPADALLVVAGRIDVPAFAEFLGDFLPPDDRRKLVDQFERYLARPNGLNLVKDILPNLGPDWGLCVLAPGAKEPVMPQVLAALRVRPGDGKKPVDRALFGVLDKLAFLGSVVGQQVVSDPVSIESTMHAKVEIKYLDAKKTAEIGLQPAYALAEGYLLLATSPGPIKVFGPALAVADSAGDCPLLRISFRSLRGYLKARSDELAPHVAAKHQISAEEAKRRLQGVVDFCQFFDRLELTRRIAPGQVALTLRLHTEQPLAK